MKYGLFFKSVLIAYMYANPIFAMELLDAARKNNTSEVKKLLEQGVDNLDYQDYQDWSFTRYAGQMYGNLTPLMLGAFYGNLEMVKLLLAAGARTDLKSSEGLTAEQIANQELLLATRAEKEELAPGAPGTGTGLKSAEEVKAEQIAWAEHIAWKERLTKVAQYIKENSVPSLYNLSRKEVGKTQEGKELLEIYKEILPPLKPKLD